jgi:hypothetical protein
MLLTSPSVVRNRVVLVGALIGAAGAAACTTVRQVHPVQYFAQNSPDVVWVTYTNNAVVPVAQPDLNGDTLKGMKPGTQEPVAIPLDQVRSVSARLPDNRKTAVLVTGLLAGFVGSVYTLWISKAGSNTRGVTCGFNEDAIPNPYC